MIKQYCSEETKNENHEVRQNPEQTEKPNKQEGFWRYKIVGRRLQELPKRGPVRRKQKPQKKLNVTNESITPKTETNVKYM